MIPNVLAGGGGFSLGTRNTLTDSEIVALATRLRLVLGPLRPIQ